MLSSVHPKSALICETVAPELAALVAANFLNPWADFFMPAWLQGFTKHVDKAFFDEFFSLLLQINVSSPIGPVASVAANLGKMGRKTSV